MSTTFENKLEILGEFFWHRLSDEEFAKFIADNFSGLCLAFTYKDNLATPTTEGIALIDITFTNLLTEFWGNSSDKGYSCYDDFTGDWDV